jgi:hypothetical protein
MTWLMNIPGTALLSHLLVKSSAALIVWGYRSVDLVTQVVTGVRKGLCSRSPQQRSDDV